MTTVCSSKPWYLPTSLHRDTIQKSNSVILNTVRTSDFSRVLASKKLDELVNEANFHLTGFLCVWSTVVNHITHSQLIQISLSVAM